jgi:hypothetical protein
MMYGRLLINHTHSQYIVLSHKSTLKPKPAHDFACLANQDFADTKKLNLY